MQLLVLPQTCDRLDDAAVVTLLKRVEPLCLNAVASFLRVGTRRHPAVLACLLCGRLKVKLNVSHCIQLVTDEMRQNTIREFQGNQY